MNSEMTFENDIIKDSYYLIKLFNDDKKSITPLHIQKLMYLFEGYYMNVKDTNKLYECDYQAWNFGPVAIPLYKNFKKYGRNNIILNAEQLEIANNVCEEKKKLLEKIYKAFGEFSAMDLVKFTHVDGSPWKEAWDYQEYSIINKEKLKEWFSKYVQKK